jgi:hypothetical protein
MERKVLQACYAVGRMEGCLAKAQCWSNHPKDLVCTSCGLLLCCAWLCCNGVCLLPCTSIK